MIYNNIVVERDGLKDVIYEKAKSNISTLINEPGFEGLLRRINDFAADILVSLIQNENQKVGNIMYCQICNSRHIICGCSNGAVPSGTAVALVAAPPPNYQYVNIHYHLTQA